MNPRNIKRIVYFNSGAIGEYLMTLHFFDVVRAACDRMNVVSPEFVVVVGKSEDMLRTITMADDVSIVRPSLLRCGAGDVLVLQQTFGKHSWAWRIAAVLARVAGARVTGFKDVSRIEQRLFPHTRTFNVDSTFPEQMVELARSMGYAAESATPHLHGFDVFSVNNDDFAPARIFVNPCAASPRRTPTVSCWVQILSEIERRLSNVHIVLGGSSNDLPVCESIASGAPNRTVIAGMMTLDAVAREISSCDVYIGPDTGITHLAAFLDVPSVVVGTNSTPCWWSTYSPRTTWLSSKMRCVCDGKKGTQCLDMVDGSLRYRCMVDIPVSDIVDAVLTKIQENG